MAEPRIVPLALEQIGAASEALARAFHDDPLQTYVFPDPVERASRSVPHFAALLRYGLRFGKVLTTDAVPLGAAIWLPPDGWEMTPERAAAGGLDQLPTLLGTESAGRFTQALSAVEPFHHSDVSSDHWYVMVLGVAPEAQGRGLGRGLLEPVIGRADAARMSCYLETSQPANVTFYTHLGFRVLRDVVDPPSGLRMWTFRRDPPID